MTKKLHEPCCSKELAERIMADTDFNDCVADGCYKYKGYITFPYSMVETWLRKEHYTSVFVKGYGAQDGNRERTGTFRYKAEASNMRTFTLLYQEDGFETYEDAMEECLKYIIITGQY